VRSCTSLRAPIPYWIASLISADRRTHQRGDFSRRAGPAEFAVHTNEAGGPVAKSSWEHRRAESADDFVDQTGIELAFIERGEGSGHVRLGRYGEHALPAACQRPRQALHLLLDIRDFPDQVVEGGSVRRLARLGRRECGLGIGGAHHFVGSQAPRFRRTAFRVHQHRFRSHLTPGQADGFLNAVREK
jgi:hypothetical protein